MSGMFRVRGIAAAVAALSIGGLLAAAPRRLVSAQEKKKTAAELEKEKAMQHPYPNDLGPEGIDEVVKGYPKDKQEGYKLMTAKCSRCHSSARPLNSRFVEPDADRAKRAAVVAEWKKSRPELFAQRYVWQIEEDIWQRYVKRMKAKPGCDLSDAEAKRIWGFLVYDSNQRKLGKNAAAWEAHRKKLLEEFKEKYPKRYEELERQKAL